MTKLGTKDIFSSSDMKHVISSGIQNWWQLLSMHQTIERNLKEGVTNFMDGVHINGRDALDNGREKSLNNGLIERSFKVQINLKFNLKLCQYNLTFFI